MKDREVDIEIYEKESLDLESIHKIVDRAKNTRIAIAHSAFLLSPKLVKGKKDRKYDPIVGSIVYDLKNDDVLAFNLATMRQLSMHLRNIRQEGLAHCVSYLLDRSFSHEEEKISSFLSAPIRVPNYTPLPWIIYSVLQETLSDKIRFEDPRFRITIPHFFVFGLPPLPTEKPSFIFEPEKQKALFMMKFRDKNDEVSFQLRFDRSKGEPTFHVDFQIFAPRHQYHMKKLLKHISIDLREIWEFDNTLYVAFLPAGAYDIKMDKIITQIKGFDQLVQEEPVALYPLIMRALSKDKENWLKENSDALKLLKLAVSPKFSPSSKDRKTVAKLEEKGLLHENRPTILADIVLTRMKGGIT